MTTDRLRMTLAEKIKSAIHDSIAALQDLLRVEQYQTPTHLTVIVSGWGNSLDTKRLVAQYLVGLRGSAIDCALNIRACLLDDSDIGRLDLYRSVLEIVGESNDALEEEQKRVERNPWISEAIWHLCMVLSNKKPEIHPPGKIIAVKDVHVRAKDHGLDGLALYANDQGIGLTVIESKAYKNDPNGAISKAITYFKEIDEEKHTTRIRQDVNTIRLALPSKLQKQVRESFWKKRRTYMPNPHYEAETKVDWTRSRSAFSLNLSVPKECIIIMPHIIQNFDLFFDDISDLMRDFARRL